MARRSASTSRPTRCCARRFGTSSTSSARRCPRAIAPSCCRDYGYPRAEYYLPERRDGTLVCHRRHVANADPFALPGLQDITAFVDFTALAEAGVGAGFELAGYCSQASFLIANGLGEQLQAIEAIADPVERHRRTNEVKRLTLPGEMGERFQAMGFQRGVDMGLAFAVGDLTRRL